MLLLYVRRRELNLYPAYAGGCARVVVAAAADGRLINSNDGRDINAYAIRSGNKGINITLLY